jgi:hypothetical protein
LVRPSHAPAAMSRPRWAMPRNRCWVDPRRSAGRGSGEGIGSLKIVPACTHDGRMTRREPFLRTSEPYSPTDCSRRNEPSNLLRLSRSLGVGRRRVSAVTHMTIAPPECYRPEIVLLRGPRCVAAERSSAWPRGRGETADLRSAATAGRSRNRKCSGRAKLGTSARLEGKSLTFGLPLQVAVSA